MSETAGNPPNSSAPYGKKKGGSSMMYTLVAVMLVVGLVVGYVLGAALSTPADTGSNDRLRDVLDRGQLIVASDTTWPPFEIYNSTSKAYEGVDIDIVQRIADELGVQLVVKEFTFDAIIGGVQAGQADIAISSITILPSRAEAVNFSVPYYMANQGIVVKDGSGITSAAGLAGKTIGAQIGTTGLYWAQANLTSSTVNTYTDIPTAMVALEQGLIDAVICDTPVANNYADDPSYSIVLSFTVITNEEYGIAIAKGSPALLLAINAILEEMKADGSLHAILVKWNAD
jgi:polar amino acid transport system substrate-binding protein